MAEWVAAIALWCGDPAATGRGVQMEWLRTVGEVQTCRKKLLVCVSEGKKVPEKCFTADGAKLGD